jgi:hypothetical protein
MAQAPKGFFFRWDLAFRSVDVSAAVPSVGDAVALDAGSLAIAHAIQTHAESSEMTAPTPNPVGGMARTA